MTGPGETKERVLSTLNTDGSRRWLYPRPSPGRFLRWRRVVGYALIVLFAVLPWIRVDGRQSVLVDIPGRTFTFFGMTFLPTDTLLAMLLFASVFVAIFLVTALFGRVWCGWACPQTVYLELVYRPIERLFDGSPDARRRGAPGASGMRKALKYAAFLLVSLFLAHTFLAYFVGVEALFQWMRQSPLEHPRSFAVMAFTTGLMMFDFCFFREQTCILACPYGRFQSALLDRSSLIISYDRARGEPRGKIRRGAPADEPRGDCVDCHLCVITCPTGIDIRDGLQMECVGCAQCIDACDAVMTKVGRPTGLIRYSSQEAMESGRRRLLRPRVVIYPLILAVLLAVFGVTLAGRQGADVTLLRGDGTTFETLATGEVANDMELRITNRTDAPRTYGVAIEGLDGARVEPAGDALEIEPGATATWPVRVIVPRDAFEVGRAHATLRVTDDARLDTTIRCPLQGPWGRGPGAAEEEPA